MTNKTTSAIDLLALAERCEAATGPDGHLDMSISEATGIWRNWPTFVSFRPTGSMDAAKALLEHLHGKNAVIWRLFAGGRSPIEAAVICDAGDIESRGANEALAICAASLRAKASLESGQ